MDEQVDLGGIVLLEVLIHLQPLDHTAGQHAVGLPALVILQGAGNTTQIQAREAIAHTPADWPKWTRLHVDTISKLKFTNLNPNSGRLQQVIPYHKLIKFHYVRNTTSVL